LNLELHWEGHGFSRADKLIPKVWGFSPCAEICSRDLLSWISRSVSQMEDKKRKRRSNTKERR
jgi:hypothetical protein